MNTERPRSIPAGAEAERRRMARIILLNGAGSAGKSSLAKALQVKAGSPALTVVRRYYGLHEELFEVTVTTHPEGRYTYSMDMQRSLRPLG